MAVGALRFGRLPQRFAGRSDHGHRRQQGRLYYHFTNRESVAAAIIEEADAMLQTTSREILPTPREGRWET